MLLSIIVPVYNVEKYLKESVNSIIRQKFTDFELLLVDDGSSDKSGSLCEELAAEDARIRVIHQSNSGPSAARNRGLKEAKGKFITFIDSDDVVDENYLSNFRYDENLDFEIQGLTLNYIGNENNNREIKPHSTHIAPIKDIYSEAELNRLSRGPCVKLFKISIIKANKIEFPEGIRFGEDAIFVKRYLQYCNGYGRSICSADYYYNHFPNQQSLTTKRHPGEMMYNVAYLDYRLFKRLEEKWGPMEEAVLNDFMRIRALEFYQSICLCMTEKDRTLREKSDFISMAKNGMFHEIKTVPNMPITYKVIKGMITCLSNTIAAALLSVLFRMRK